MGSKNREKKELDTPALEITGGGVTIPKTKIPARET